MKKFELSLCMVWFKNLPRDLPNFGVHLVEHKTGFGGGLEVKLCEPNPNPNSWSD